MIRRDSARPRKLARISGLPKESQVAFDQCFVMVSIFRKPSRGVNSAAQSVHSQGRTSIWSPISRISDTRSGDRGTTTRRSRPWPRRRPHRSDQGARRRPALGGSPDSIAELHGFLLSGPLPVSDLIPSVSDQRKMMTSPLKNWT